MHLSRGMDTKRFKRGKSGTNFTKQREQFDRILDRILENRSSVLMVYTCGKCEKETITVEMAKACIDCGNKALDDD